MAQGDIIRDSRTKQRMTQAMLAQAAGISSKTVVRAEAGAPLSDEVLRAICAVLGLEVTDFPPSIWAMPLAVGYPTDTKHPALRAGCRSSR